MTLPTEVNLLLAGNQGYRISRSVRLRASATAYFQRTPAGASNRQTWTYSAWVKRGNLGTYQGILAATAGTPMSFGFFNTDVFFMTISGLGNALTTAVFRDPSAWYHIVIAFDTTQATAANRVLIYVNGVNYPLSSTLVTLNANYQINTATVHQIGTTAVSGSATYTDAYLTEINFVDGQRLTPTSFGENNSVTGVWQPKKYTGTYGTNGYYLNFSDNSAATAAAIGADYSGNGNNWTPTNVSVTAGATYDSMIDVPTPYADGGNGRGNYAVLNEVNTFTPNGITNAHLKIAGTATNVSTISGISITPPTSGKFYIESVVETNTNAVALKLIGTTTANFNAGAGSEPTATTRYGWEHNQSNILLWNGGATAITAFAGAPAVGTIIQLAFDFGAGKMWLGKNNTWYNSGDPVAGTNASATFSAGAMQSLYALALWVSPATAASFSINFGQRPFTYTPPTGYNTLNTQNLPASTITNGANYMAATLYTGTGSTLTVANTVNGVSFQPDMVWMKSRSAATNHALYDVVRGTTKQLILTTAAETTEATGLTAFTSTGFTVGALAALNTNAATYAAWNWKAGGTAVTNTDGTISSQVSANTSAGFSVVTYAGNGTAGATVGHGLGVAPSMVIVKSLAVNNFPVFHIGNATPARDIFYLNLTNAVAVNTTFWNNVLPSSSVITLGTNSHTNTNAQNYVAYCWAAVAGYSAFGSYTGNGAADGPFVYTGFRPRWIMIKYIAGATNWLVWDTSRTTSNVMGEELYPNLTTIGTVATDLDILSNGFKIRNTTAAFNTSGGLMVYAAFAENPFKNALAR